MPDSHNYQELATRYGLEPVPDSVTRLTQLVARQEAPLDAIARLIAEDKQLTASVLRAANPRAECEADYVTTTVEEALARTGIGCALLLAMGAPLTFALHTTFDTMLGLKLESKSLKTVTPLRSEHLSGRIGFSGKAEGQVVLHLSLESARMIAAHVLGLAPQDDVNPAEINDVVGELLNIVTGNFKSNLCDAGLNCRLQPPVVKRTTDFSGTAARRGVLERMVFQTGQILVFVDLTVNPWQNG